MCWLDKCWDKGTDRLEALFLGPAESEIKHGALDLVD